MNGMRVTAAVRLSSAALTASLLGLSATSMAVADSSPTSPDKVGAWGDTMKWDDGLKVTVSKPVKFTSSDTAAGHEPGHQPVKWRIKVQNGTDEAFQGSSLTVYVKSGADGESCGMIADVDSQVGEGISGSVSPGSAGTAQFAFDVPRSQLGKVDVEVQPSFDHEGLHWVGEVP